MPTWAIPLVIQGAESLLVGVATFLAVYGATADVHKALAAAAGAMAGKMMPRQFLGNGSGPAPKP